MSDDRTLQRLIEVTERFARDRPSDLPLSGTSAISQDAYIFGVDVEDYVGLLEAEFGPIVWEIPWLRFTDQSDSYRGCAVGLFPFILFVRILAWPVTRKPLLKVPNPRTFPHRLELRHIAKVIDQGYWSEP